MFRITLFVLCLVGFAPAVYAAPDEQCQRRGQGVFVGQPGEVSIRCQLDLVENNLVKSALVAEAKRADAVLLDEGFTGVVASISKIVQIRSDPVWLRRFNR